MDIFDKYRWHSSSEVGENIIRKKIINKLSSTNANLDRFIRVAGSDFLIHKSTKALWKMSDDGSIIEPTFDDDILTEDNL